MIEVVQRGFTSEQFHSRDDLAAVRGVAVSEPVHGLSAFDARIPNPASEFCVTLGGISTIADVGAWGGAQIGLCRLSDDAVIESWTLWRAVRNNRLQAIETFEAGQWRPRPGPIETWADDACEEAGGLVVECAMHLRPSTIVRMCEFPDRSMIEIWTAFGGPGFYPKLARLTGEPSSLPEENIAR